LESVFNPCLVMVMPFVVSVEALAKFG
jgi:hypothetical protein